MRALRFLLVAASPLLFAAAPASAQSSAGDLGNFLRTNSGTLSSGSSVNGTLQSGDLVRNDGTLADGYLYNGQAGEQLTVTLRSNQFDSWLVIDDPNSSFREMNDDGDGGTNSRLTVTLPRTATYIIVANTVSKGAIGAYSLAVQSNRPSGGSGGTSTSSSGSGDGQLSTLYRRGGLPRIGVGQAVNGQLSSSDYLRSDGTYADAYLYNATAGEELKITLRSKQFDSWVVVDEPNGPFRETDDDAAGDNDSQLTVTIPRSGQYLIVANSVSKGATGSYTLSVSRP